MKVLFKNKTKYTKEMYIHEATKFLIIFKSVPSIKFWKKTSYILKLLEKSENIFRGYEKILTKLRKIGIPIKKIE